jgi:hypothetical protein
MKYPASGLGRFIVMNFVFVLLLIASLFVGELLNIDVSSGLPLVLFGLHGVVYGMLLPLALLALVLAGTIWIFIFVVKVLLR